MNGCWVAGCGVNSCVGQGVETLFSAWSSGASGLKRMARFDATRYQTAWAGEVAGAMDGGKDLVSALLAPAMQEALEQARQGGVSREALREALVVVATTKEDTTSLEAFVRDGAVTTSPASKAFWKEWKTQFGLDGPVQMVSLACASGSAAIAYAGEQLQAGVCSTAVVIGIDVLSDFILTGFSSLKSLDLEPCRPFDRDRQGLTLGEAAAVMILTADRPTVMRGRVRGWGLANDATHLTAPNREGVGLAQACERALQHAACAPGDVIYVNAHGTGTAYNDAMEAKAMAKVFGLPGPPLSTLKGTTGHTVGAAGVVEAALTLEVLSRRSAPPTTGLKHAGVEEALDLIIQTPRPLPAGGVALSLSAGFGGFNAVLVLEGAA